MLKSGPKKRFPKKEAAEGVADDIALRSDCSSSVGAVNKEVFHEAQQFFKVENLTSFWQLLWFLSVALCEDTR